MPQVMPFGLRPLFFMSLLAASSVAAWADTEYKSWRGEASAGYSSSQGNTNTRDLSGAVNLRYLPSQTSNWEHRLNFGAFTAASDNEQTAERYYANVKAQWNFADVDYAFASLGFEKDRFSGVDTRYSGAVGYGCRLLNSKEHKLNAELGAGARYSQIPDGVGDHTSRSEAIVRGFVDYRWRLTEHSRFNQTLLAEAGDDNTLFESLSALHLDIYAGLSAKVSYTIKHNTDVPQGTKRTDRYTGISIVYGFL